MLFCVKYLGQGPADTGDVSSTADFHDLRANARFDLLYSDGSAYYVIAPRGTQKRVGRNHFCCRMDSPNQGITQDSVEMDMKPTRNPQGAFTAN